MANVPSPFAPAVVKLESTQLASSSSGGKGAQGGARRFFPKAVRRPDTAPQSSTQAATSSTEAGAGVKDEVTRNARHDSKWQPREYKSFHQLAFEATGGVGGLAPVLEGSRGGPAVVQSKVKEEDAAAAPSLNDLKNQTKNPPTSLPISAHLEEDKTECFIDSGSEELKEDTLFLIQLPALLPLPLDQKVAREKRPDELKTTLVGHPPGQCGKLVVHKSGKIKLRLGNCMMDVSLAKSGTFAQNLVAVNPIDDCCYFLGDVSHIMVVSPALTELPGPATCARAAPPAPLSPFSATSGPSSSPALPLAPEPNVPPT